ncbi:MAG: HEAT repeat domain-containing protein [Planctomycetes bacterium]|nr:HEAT repeat domain-containing protein [Planctomycetota bacterium]MCB9884501.1 HEAT repeat domain-containing protein [Planctomycetota bacterium]
MSALRIFSCVLGLAALLSAHGGQYRGAVVPNQPVPPPPSGNPSTPPGLRPAPGPGIPGATPGPGIGTPVGDNPLTEWHAWWEFNKDPYVQARGLDKAGPETGSDDFYLGVRRAVDRIDTLAPTDDDKQKLILPVLVKLLEEERNRDVQSACLVALGKIGRDVPGDAPAGGLEALLSARISRGDQEVRETAVLALGIAGRVEALPLLAALVRDDAVGRKLESREYVSNRTRAFAAYALGLLAHRSEDAAVDQQIAELLLGVLRDKALDDRDLRCAALNGLGILGCGDSAGAGKLLLWRTVESLLEYHGKDLGRGDELVQAHAPIAIGRLLGRGSTSLHQRCKQRFADELLARKRRSNPILQSSAIALGMLVEPTSDDQEFVDALRDTYEDGHDRLARSFALMAMARIGGADNKVWLLRAYERGNKSTERPWIALALGMWAACGNESERGDPTIVRRLTDDLQDSSNRDTTAALAIAVGLTRHPLAFVPLTETLRTSEANERVAGYCAVALGLLGDRNAVPMLSQILARSERRQFLLPQTALALGMLGDRQANEQLVAMMKKSQSVTSLSALAKAIGQIGDRRAIEPLCAILADHETTKLGRAFVAAALGGVGDKDLLPWNLPLSVDCNYATGMDTLTNGSTGVLDIL